MGKHLRLEGMTRIIADFKTDWHEQLLEQMRSVWGDQVDRIDGEDVPFRFFDSLRRDISTKPRLLKISDDFVCPVVLEAGWTNLQRKIDAGEPLKPHLSKAHWSFSNQDGLLDDWGIHHFHLGIEPDPAQPEFVMRTGPLIYAFVTEDTFYAINTYEHKDQAWARDEVVEVMHRNWPEAIQQFVLHSVSPDPMTERERIALRRKRGNAVVTMRDGTIYGPFGGLVSASGMAVEATVRTSFYHHEIKIFQLNVEESAEQIALHLKKLGHILEGDLYAKFVIHDGEMAVHLPDLEVTLKMTFEPF